MLPGLANDLAHILGHAGVEITLGAVSVYGRVRELSAEEAAGENAPSHEAPLVTIDVPAGSLTGLANGVTIDVDGAAYRVHRHYPVVTSALTRIIAYPSDATPSDLWMGAETLLAWAERGAGAAPGPVLDLDALGGYPVALFEAIAATDGTNPALNVAVHHADLEAGPFTASGVSFDEVGEEDSFQVRALDRASGAIKRYVRLAATITGTGAPAFWCQAALLDAALPR